MPHDQRREAASSKQPAMQRAGRPLRLTMLASMTCPLPDFVLSSSARTIPRAQVRPPPAKSANRFRGAQGVSPLRPSRDKRPEAQNTTRALVISGRGKIMICSGKFSGQQLKHGENRGLLKHFFFSQDLFSLWRLCVLEGRHRLRDNQGKPFFLQRVS